MRVCEFCPRAHTDPLLLSTPLLQSLETPLEPRSNIIRTILVIHYNYKHKVPQKHLQCDQNRPGKQEIRQEHNSNPLQRHSHMYIFAGSFTTLFGGFPAILTIFPIAGRVMINSSYNCVFEVCDDFIIQ